jgi:hypothetical protein
MMRVLCLGLAIAAGAFSSGCTYSNTTRAVPAPAPTPAPVVQRTVYPDGTYVDTPVQPVR